MSFDADTELLVPHSKDPLYVQIFVILRNKILRGDWQPAAKLPSEPELMTQFEVSRTTIRLALDRLVDDGLIYRQRGRGTFVASQRIAQDRSEVFDFGEVSDLGKVSGFGEISGLGIDAPVRTYQSSIRLLSSGPITASSHTAMQLGVDLGAELVMFQRLHLHDGEPIGVESVCLVHDHCPGILEHDLGQNSVAEIIERSYGLRRGRIRQMVRAVAASRTTGKLLCVSAGTPLLYVERIVHLAEPDVPLELQKIHYRGDRYVLRSEF